MQTIYKPRFAAGEYADYALNIYTGCPHRCWYCFVPKRRVRKINGTGVYGKEAFHTDVRPREADGKDIIRAAREYVSSTKMTGKTIHLCSTCDPYPTGCDCSATREIIKILKDAGNHVQILTKGDGTGDFDLLNENDWYGISLDGTTDMPHQRGTALRIDDLRKAHEKGIRTWVSFEPVVYPAGALQQIRETAPFADKVKIGKLNYFDEFEKNIDWKAFGKAAEALCRELGVEYYIKEGLRFEMNR